MSMIHYTVGYLRANAEQLRTRLAISKLETSWICFGPNQGSNKRLISWKIFPLLIATSVEELELLNLVDCSKLMGSFALQRRESRGSHFREDYPSRNPEWNGCHSIFRDGKIELTRL